MSIDAIKDFPTCDDQDCFSSNVLVSCVEMAFEP